MRETQSGVISGWGPRARPVCLGPSCLSDTIDVGWDLKKKLFSPVLGVSRPLFEIFYFILFYLLFTELVELITLQ